MARERLKIIYENSDGFEIARHDLRMRGPGELLGARQSGVPMLRFADLERDLDLLEAARDAAERMLRSGRSTRKRISSVGWVGARNICGCDYCKIQHGGTEDTEKHGEMRDNQVAFACSSRLYPQPGPCTVRIQLGFVPLRVLRVLCASMLDFAGMIWLRGALT